jgi:hypothetical protein
MPEYVYCIANKAMPNKSKSGGTARTPEIRCDDFFTTALPIKCNVEYYIKVNNFKEAEKYIHKRIIEMGIKKYDRREWFECNPSDIKHIYDEYAELFPYDSSKEKISNQDNKQYNKKIFIKNNKQNKIYNCTSCNYNTEDKGNYYHHKKTNKHLMNINNIEILKKENEELKQKLLQKEIETKLLQKDQEIETKLLQKEIENLIAINKIYKE